MRTITTSYTIKAPKEFVFYNMFSEKVMSLLIPDFVSLYLHEIKAGAKFIITTDDSETPITITDVDAPNWIRLKIHWGFFQMSIFEQYETNGHETIVTTEITLEKLHFLGIFFVSSFYRRIRKNHKYVTALLAQLIEDAYQHSQSYINTGTPNSSS